MKHSKGETVVYGGSGVCQIDDIRDISFYHERPQKYYVLKPLFVKQSQTVYVPMNNEKLTAKIQPVISREEALELIHGINDNDVEWIEDRNLRKDTFNDLVMGGNRKPSSMLLQLSSTREGIFLQKARPSICRMRRSWPRQREG